MAQQKPTDTSVFPPPGFEKTTSAIDGIVVYKPVDNAGKHEYVKNFRCAQCNGETAFSAADGGITCTYCGHHEAPTAALVGKSAESFEFTVATVQQQATHGWGVDRTEIVCQTCGSHLTLPAQDLTTTCPFCHSNKVIQHKAPQDVLRPRFLVPFNVNQDQCHNTTVEWLAASWLTPKELRKLAAVGQFDPIYMPFWTFDAHAEAAWRAQVAHKRGKQTVWRWKDGRVAATFSNVLVKGSDRLAAGLLDTVNKFDLNGLVPYSADFLAGTQAVAYENTLDTAWEEGRHNMRDRVKKQCKRQIPGRSRNFSMQLDFADESWRYILLPVYVASYHYNNESYQVLINGQTGAIAGQRPADWTRVIIAALLLLLPGAAVMLSGWLLEAEWAAVGLILFIIGAVLAIIIALRAAKLDKA